MLLIDETLITVIVITLKVWVTLKVV